ncbi:MAG: RNA polymerase sigma factor [Chryseolinea sp.]
MNSSQFNEALGAVLPALWGFSRRFTRDRDECDDLVQDTMLKALTYRHRYQHDVNLKGWLYTIMRNIFISHYHEKKRVTFSHDEAAGRRLSRIADDHTSNKPSVLMEMNEILTRVNTLRDDLRAPLEMSITGYKYHEIAETLEIPIGTVKNRIHHARLVLRDILAR